MWFDLALAVFALLPLLLSDPARAQETVSSRN